MKKYKNTEMLVRACDEDFFSRLNKISDAVISSQSKVISLSGPICSGKTTAANMLLRRFRENGIVGHLISIDDFFFDRERLLKLSFEKGLDTPDYDSLDTIDFKALKIFIEEIFDSDEVHCPIFNFQSGIRDGYKTLKIEDNSVFVFEGIQAIYPEVSKELKNHNAISIYIAPESKIESAKNIFYPNEIRLMRRIVRDYNFRGTSPEVTLEMWESVRKNEELNIFPYVDNCEYHIDSTMPYEIGVLTPYLRKILKNVSANHRYYRQAEEMLDKIADVTSISDKFILSDSLYKEFI